ncbi:MAG: hypothetical protein WDW38_002236 [Sanguina aurantia]
MAFTAWPRRKSLLPLCRRPLTAAATHTSSASESTPSQPVQATLSSARTPQPLSPSATHPATAPTLPSLQPSVHS